MRIITGKLLCATTWGVLSTRHLSFHATGGMAKSEMGMKDFVLKIGVSFWQTVMPLEKRSWKRRAYYHTANTSNTHYMHCILLLFYANTRWSLRVSVSQPLPRHLHVYSHSIQASEMVREVFPRHKWVEGTIPTYRSWKARVLNGY